MRCTWDRLTSGAGGRRACIGEGQALHSRACYKRNDTQTLERCGCDWLTGDWEAAVRRRKSQEVDKVDPCRAVLSRKSRIVARLPGSGHSYSETRRLSHRYSGNTKDSLVPLERVLVISASDGKTATENVLICCRAVVDECEIELFQNYFSLRRWPSEIILFQRVETCLNLFQNYFRS